MLVPPSQRARGNQPSERKSRLRTDVPASGSQDPASEDDNMNLLHALFGHSTQGKIQEPMLAIPPGVPTEPKLSPELQERYRALAPAERSRLNRKAVQEATGSLRVDPHRDFAAERDAYISMELNGENRMLEDAVRANFRNPGDWRSGHWIVQVGQDESGGPWGWQIVAIDTPEPPTNILARTPCVHPTSDAAREDGEAAADALWLDVNRQLAR